MINYTRKVFSGVLISLIFGALASIVAYATRVVLARNLTPGDLGLFYAVYTLVMFLLFFRDLGIPTALVKYAAEFKALGKLNLLKTAITSSLLIQIIGSLIISVILFLTANLLTESYFHHPAAKRILYLLALYLLTSPWFVIIKATLQALQEMFWYSSLELVKNLIVIIVLIIGFFVQPSTLIPALAWALVCPVITLLYLPIVLHKFNFFSHKLVEFKLTTRKILLFGIPVLATNIAGEFISYIDTLILTGTRSLTEVGIYNVILPSALIFVFLGRAISSIILPLASELLAKQDYRRLKKGMQLLQKYFFLIVSPIIIVVAAFSEVLITVLFGENYLTGTLAMKILLIGILFYTASSININLLSGIGRPKTVAKIIFTAAITNTLLNLLFIPSYGITAAAATTALSYLIMFIGSTYSINQHLGAKLDLKDKIKLLISLIVLYWLIRTISTALFLNIWWEIVISIVISFTGYIFFTYCLGLLNIVELKYYLNLIRKKQ